MTAVSRVALGSMFVDWSIRLCSNPWKSRRLVAHLRHRLRLSVASIPKSRANLTRCTSSPHCRSPCCTTTACLAELDINTVLSDTYRLHEAAQLSCRPLESQHDVVHILTLRHQRADIVYLFQELKGSQKALQRARSAQERGEMHIVSPNKTSSLAWPWFHPGPRTKRWPSRPSSWARPHPNGLHSAGINWPVWSPDAFLTRTNMGSSPTGRSSPDSFSPEGSVRSTYHT